MKQFLILLVALFVSAQEQNPGAVTVATTATIAATAGGVTCSFMNNGATIQTQCKGLGASESETLPVPIPQPAVIGTFNAGTDVVTWGFVPPGSTANGGCASTVA